MKTISGKSLEELCKEAINECKNSNEKVIENVILNGEFEIAEIESSFIKMHTDVAEKWQDSKRPKELLINHGEYIYKGEQPSEKKGINFILNELKTKEHGNRACYSLVNMEDIVKSGDDALPSFMVLQFSFSRENSDTLLVSAYFRALEVKNFLPINLAEICLNIKSIKSKIIRIKRFELNIFAFRAQYIENYNCLRQSKLDILNSVEMYKSLISDKKLIIDALKDKKNMVESVIIDVGIRNLKEAIKEIDETILKNVESIKATIDDISEEIAQIEKMRTTTSIQNDMKKETNMLKDKFEDLISFLELDK